MEHAVIGREGNFMVMKGVKSYTVADIEALPEGERAELIDGELFRHYVDPQRETVTVYDSEHGRETEEYSFSERIKAGIYEDLTIEIIK